MDISNDKCHKIMIGMKSSSLDLISQFWNLRTNGFVLKYKKGTIGKNKHLRCMSLMSNGDHLKS